MALIYKTIETEAVTAEAVIELAQEFSGQTIQRLGNQLEGFDVKWHSKSSDPFFVHVKSESGKLLLTYYWDENPALYRLVLYCSKRLAEQRNLQEMYKPLPWTEKDIIDIDKHYTALHIKDARWLWGYIYAAVAVAIFVFVGILYTLYKLFWQS